MSKYRLSQCTPRTFLHYSMYQPNAQVQKAHSSSSVYGRSRVTTISLDLVNTIVAE